MSFLYVVSDDCEIGLSGGRIRIEYPEETEYVPKETVDGVSVFGNAQLTTPCLKYFMDKGIRVGYFSKSGSYKGMLCPAYSTNSVRLKKQVLLSENREFCLGIAKKIIRAKINNQIVVAKRYLHENAKEKHYADKLLAMKNSLKKVSFMKEISHIMGYEGMASRVYFEILSDVVKDGFMGKGRSKRPPKDPFNSMISLGYSLLMKEIYGEIESHGLNGYISFVRQIREGHPALASDMVEEWRATIVDATVLSMIQGNEIDRGEFVLENGRCQMTDDALKRFLIKLENRMHSTMSYVKDVRKPLTFREAVWHQVGMLAKTVESGNSSAYNSIWIR